MLRSSGAGAVNPRPDLVVMDINMPKKSGHETLAEIKSDPNLKAIPVIMFSSSSAPSDVQKSYENNANAHIIKTQGFEEMKDLVSGISSFWFNLSRLPNKAA